MVYFLYVRNLVQKGLPVKHTCFIDIKIDWHDLCDYILCGVRIIVPGFRYHFGRYA